MCRNLKWDMGRNHACLATCFLSFCCSSCLTLCDPKDCSPPGKNTGVGSPGEGDHPSPGIEPRSPALAGQLFTVEPQTLYCWACLLSPGTGLPSLLPPQLSPSHLGHLCSRYGSCPQSPVRTLADGNKFLLHLSLKLATFCHVTNYPQIWWLKTTFLTTSCSIGQVPGCGLAESSASEYHRLQSVGWGCCPH